jgi:thioredoxin-related protein
MKKIIVFLIAFTVFFGACKQEKTKTKYYVYFLHDNMTEYCESFGDTLKVEKAITEWRTKSKLNTVQILKSYQ